jgi:hypothetical protein
MPRAEKVFTLSQPLERVWEFLNDLPAVGSCLPGCEQVRVLSEVESEWTVKLKVGPISKTIHARAHTTERRPPYRAAFVAEAEEVRLEGALELRPLDVGKTEVTYRSQVTGKGSLQKLIEQIMKGRLADDAEAFAQKVRAHLEG